LSKCKDGNDKKKGNWVWVPAKQPAAQTKWFHIKSLNIIQYQFVRIKKSLFTIYEYNIYSRKYDQIYIINLFLIKWRKFILE
jgi:hypothetical protein